MAMKILAILVLHLSNIATAEASFDYHLGQLEESSIYNEPLELSRIVDEVVMDEWIKNHVIKQIKVAMGIFKAHAKEYPTLNHERAVALSRRTSQGKYHGLYFKY